MASTRPDGLIIHYAQTPQGGLCTRGQYPDLLRAAKSGNQAKQYSQQQWSHAAKFHLYDRIGKGSC
jgi:hypothetical protein